MGMSKQSSKETRGRAKDLAAAIGSYHVDMNIDDVFHAQRGLITQSLHTDPKFKVEGGSNAENLVFDFQNIQVGAKLT